MPVAERTEPSTAADQIGTTASPRRARRPRLPWPTWELLFVLPALLFISIFVAWPIVYTIALSAFEWNLVSPDRRFVAATNYGSLLGDRDFYALLLRSLLYVALALLGNFLLPVGLAMLTTRCAGRAASIYQTLFFTPTVIATAVGALIWQYLYLPSGGPLNELVGLLGLSPVNWLNDPSTALPAVGVVAAWKTMGFNYVIALAGLAAISRPLLEAAHVDGASGWRLLRYVVIPLLMPTLAFIATTSILQALPHAFVPIEVLTGGGPANSSNNLLYAIYQDGLRFFQVGKANAEAVLLMMLVGGAAVWQVRILDRTITYDR